MARPIERIEQDIVELEKAIGAIAEQLQNSYESYLEVLGEAVGKQLILASYHLCTQGYSQNFLKLSLNQRQKFQQAMRKLGKVAAQDMKALMNDNEELAQTDQEVEEIDREFSEEEIEEKLEFEDEDLEEILQELKPEDEGLEGIVQKLQSEDEDLEGIAQKLKSEDEDSVVNNFSSETSSVSLPKETKVPPLSSPSIQSPLFPQTPPLSKDWKKSFNPNTSNPMELAAWQKNLERAIAYILKSLSRDGNRLLQKTNILPKKLPEPILEAAAISSEASTETMPGPPNILKLVVGIEGEHQESENLSQVMALNLRLVEIEFADIKLSSERKKIRNILNQLAKFGREYQKKQRELSIANAEAAWRASWYED